MLPARRLEDQIRELSSEAVTTSDPVELDKLLEELKAALHLHTQRVRERAQNRHTGRLPFIERRS